jgi:hypothetical protein
MAKDKKVELEYKIEGLKRIFTRKKKRLKKYTKNVENRKKGCSCDEYCYCGDGTPYSY